LESVFKRELKNYAEIDFPSTPTPHEPVETGLTFSGIEVTVAEIGRAIP
jgi:hypothetical protein